MINIPTLYEMKTKVSNYLVIFPNQGTIIYINSPKIADTECSESAIPKLNLPIRRSLWMYFFVNAKVQYVIESVIITMKVRI